MSTFIYTILCVILSLATWPIGLALTSVIFLWRLGLSSIFFHLYDRKLKLMSPNDAFNAFDERPKAHHTITTAILVRQPNFGPKSLVTLQQKIMGYVENPVNRKLLCCPIVKFGFYCWKDVTDSFVVEQHVKLCPEAGNWNRVCSRAEFNKIITHAATPPFPASRPKWELLVIPKVNNGTTVDKDGNKKKDICVAFVFRNCHSYMDGVSMARALESLVSSGSKESELKLIDNQRNTPRQTTSEQVREFAETLLYCPMEVVKNLVWWKHPNAELFQGDRHSTQNFYSRNKMSVTMSSVAQIRKAFGCSTEAIMLSALSASVISLAERKRLKVPEILRVPSSRAILPYSDDGPLNRYSALMHNVPTFGEGISSSQRLRGVMRSVEQVSENQAKYAYLLQNILGLWPAVVLSRILQSVEEGLMISVVPGLRHIDNCEGHPIVDVVHVQAPSLLYKMIVTFMEVKGNFVASFFAKESALIENALELEDLIAGFEIELQNLVADATVANNFM